MKESVLEYDVKVYAGLTTDKLSETLFKANVLPGHFTETNDLLTPVFTSYELLHIKKAVSIYRIIDYYLWAYDYVLTESEKIKGRSNCKTLHLLLLGISRDLSRSSL